MKINITKKCKKILCMITTGIVLSTVSGCTLDEYPQEQATPTDADRLFDTGQHKLAEKIDDPTEKIKQYPYHEGYKPIGMTISNYESVIGTDEVDSYIIYENTEPIKVAPTHTDVNGDTEYKNFGYTVEKHEKNSEDDKYDIYEHIVSIPYSGNVNEINFENHDGYEIVGICNDIHEGTIGNESNGCILYVNVEPVEVHHRGTKDDKIVYDTFGTPIVEEKTTEK